VRASGGDRDSRAPRPWRPIVTVGLVVAVLVAGGLAYYRADAAAIRETRHAEIAAIGALKARAIADWRRERLLGAEELAWAPPLHEVLLGWLRKGERADPRELLAAALRLKQQGRGLVDARLIDPAGRTLLSLDATRGSLDPVERVALRQAGSSKRAELSDLFRLPDGRPAVSVVAPVLDDGARAVGFVVTTQAAATFLYPLVQSWPTLSRTAETLLVRREGGAVLFLNELRHRAGAALSLRESLGAADLPATQAILGRRGVFEGKDYRGVDVIADLRAIPGTPWFMVSKVDTSEVLAEVRYHALVAALFVLLSALLVASVTASVHQARRQAERRKAEIELRAKNEELERFTYTVSHDLKSPLVTIRTFLGFVERDLRSGDSARVEDDLGYVRRAAERMTRLLDELLHLSRLGQKLGPPVEVALQDVVQEALGQVAGRVTEHRAEVEVTEQAVLLRGDRTRLVEVFQNLLDNALKFGGEAPPRIEIGAEDLDGQVVLFVRDHGVGIDPRYQDRLFGLFEKLEPESDGTGIGLALIRRIVELHGGRVWVESAGIGHGATFRFTLEGTRRGKEKPA
jgi:signal transduction histidine kinase